MNGAMTAMTTSQLLLSTWRWDPLAILACLAAIGVYVGATRAKLSPRAPYLTAAAAVVVLAVASPVGALSDGYLFSAHMLQHLLLVLIVPPLVLLGLGQERAEGAGRGERWIAPAWLVGVSAMWLWHAPTLCNAASQSAVVHRVQEASLLAMGTVYWWPILAPRAESRIAPAKGMVYLFTGCVACTILGVVVTFSPVEVCSVYLHPTDTLGVLPLLRGSWGLTADRDQQLGGLLMWVPACLVYAGGILGLLARWYKADGQRTDGPLVAQERA